MVMGAGATPFRILATNLSSSRWLAKPVFSLRPLAFGESDLADLRLTADALLQ